MSSTSTAVLSVWTSLEIAKLAVQALVPIAIFFLGTIFARRTKSLEQAIWVNQKGAEWKQSLFDRTISSLNKLYCAYNYVGDWTSFKPDDIVKLKRELDSVMYGYRMLLSAKTIEAYDRLMLSAFETSRGRGQTIRVKANVARYRESARDWQDSYVAMFVPEDKRIRREDFNALYDQFITLYFQDVGLSDAR